MNDREARSLLQAERDTLQQQLSDVLRQYRGADNPAPEPADNADRAQATTARGEEDAIVTALRHRLAAIERAEKRLDDGTYGRSVRSGAVIPDGRLAADPAVELTVEEAATS